MEIINKKNIYFLRRELHFIALRTHIDNNKIKTSGIAQWKWHDMDWTRMEMWKMCERHDDGSSDGIFVGKIDKNKEAKREKTGHGRCCCECKFQSCLLQCVLCVRTHTTTVDGVHTQTEKHMPMEYCAVGFICDGKTVDGKSRRKVFRMKRLNRISQHNNIRKNELMAYPTTMENTILVKNVVYPSDKKRWKMWIHRRLSCFENRRK